MEYKIKIGKEDDLKALVEAGRYDYKDSDISYFSFEKTEAESIELIHFDRYISSEDAIKEMEAKGLRPATATELLLFGIQHPEVQREFPVVALGTVQSVRDFRRVACLNGDSASRDLRVLWFELVWPGDYRFAAVRKLKSLDTGKLGSEKEVGSLDGQSFDLTVGGKTYEGTLKLKG